ncbi:hypothetical protein JAAARDRAFT_191572 [Jaapia argillacea MUCL 33604]|uniref:Uncharacterized protein n=1 Tax=Jaapia argillacea MUCL 33604 TaxID=933084 RepID=A0A067Q1X4_9AGAM|nr:hypothetical protein JAAARDRAFT_191572 [Jaapia argillacea MUCL 33604]
MDSTQQQNNFGASQGVQQPGLAMGGATGAGGGGGGGDALDKGVDYAERRAGHEQSHSTTEKISDGLRTAFKKATGKDVPIQDKTYQ